MVSFLVRNYEVAPLRGVTLASSRTLRAIYRHAVPNESNPLQSERNFDRAIGPEKAHRQEEFARNASDQSPRRCPVQTFYRAGQLVSGLHLPQAERASNLPGRDPLPASAPSRCVSFNVTAERFRGSSARKSLSQRDGRTVLGSAPQVKSVLKSDTLLLATAYASNGTFLPSGVGGAECLLSSNRISSFLPASALWTKRAGCWPSIAALSANVPQQT